ncbi:Hydroquinone glucosyltransferase [Apostasia shenzhenica]|uniref:Glycosyltransferase n=1 Tax=Apostasia shenzhenica TaxID=1088818 RepID=A0A2I0AEW4_9ASPA|nr:Hydroquinone glucosyltransferase [Apostasia shenzhenica]
MENGIPRPHIAVMPTPGMGHLIPFAEFAKLLVDRHHFTVTIIGFSEFTNEAQEAFLDGLPYSITSVLLPPVSLSDLPADARLETRISVATARSVPAIRSVLQQIQETRRLVAYIADLFGTDGFDAAKDVGVPQYVFIPTNFLFLTLMLELPALDSVMAGEFRELADPVRLPGFVPIPGPDILDPLQDRRNESYRWVLHNASRYREAEGIMVNTFVEIEPEAAKLLTAEENGWPAVYPVGPLIRGGGAAPHEGAVESLKWLEKQPVESVLFVSFGSGGTLSPEQTTEVALGLEASGQRFLWVVRSPSEKDSSAAYFTGRSGGGDPLSQLPEGFLQRTKEVGMVVPSWAPQIDVLASAATGGFLTHCGWNSTLESVVHGVPMIAWPLFAEQRMNAVSLVEGVKVALRPAASDDGMVDREEIARVVRELMEGEEGREIRRRVKGLKEAAAAALEEKGSSAEAIAELAKKWKSSATA